MFFFNVTMIIMTFFVKASDAFVLPTHGEGWGLPAMEAMSMELPVITTNWGGSTEFIDPSVAYPLQVENLIKVDKNVLELRGHYWAKPSVAVSSLNLWLSIVFSSSSSKVSDNIFISTVFNLVLLYGCFHAINCSFNRDYQLQLT